MSEEQQPKPPIEAVKILPDTSFLVALAISTDVHNRSAESLLGALLPYNPTFYITNIVVAETVGKIMKRENISAKKAIDRFKNIFSKLPGARRGGAIMNWQQMFDRYTRFSRKTTFRKLDTNDFVVVTEGILLGAKIITCDTKMFKIASAFVPKCIYYVSDAATKTKDESTALIAEVKKAFKASSPQTEPTPS